MSRGAEVLIIIHAQRRVFDTGYYESLNAPNMELIADDTVTSVKGDKVYTKGGRELRADVIALATGFKVRDCESEDPLQTEAARLELPASVVEAHRSVPV